VSLLTDLSSDMIFPLLPAFLVGVLGASATGLGLIEGIAEGTAAFLKLGSGWISDRIRRRKELVVLGYGLSGLVKPLMALAMAPWHVLAIRFADRTGKGVRSAPRDSLLAAASDPETRGRAFGMHRAMDTIGAILGPLVALGVLALAPGGYRLLFGLAAIPAVLSLVVLVGFVKDRRPTDEERTDKPVLSATGGRLERRYLKLLVVVLIFTLGNSSDAFLLLKAERTGVAVLFLPLLWLCFNVVYSGTSWIAGDWSDRVGRRLIVTGGFLVYAIVYVGFALASASWQIWLLFLLYGAYYGLTDGVLRATVADVVTAEKRGAAYGLYYALSGGALLIASLLAGWLWDQAGPSAPFMLGAGLAVVAAVLGWVWMPGKARSER
jgi:MFS family permease